MNRGAAVAAAFIAALGAALLWVYKQQFERSTSGGEPIEVAVATGDLSVGQELSAEDIALRGIPEAYVESRHIRAARVESILGVRTRNRLNAGETVLWGDLAVSGKNSRELPSLVAPGMRAIAIPANDSTATFDGLLRPGDRVDTMVTERDKGTGKVTTSPLLQNLIVLAVGQDTGNSLESNGSGGGRTVTLGVTPDQAHVLTSAMSKGTITLMLRNPDDVRIYDLED